MSFFVRTLALVAVATLAYSTQVAAQEYLKQQANRGLQVDNAATAESDNAAHLLDGSANLRTDEVPKAADLESVAKAQATPDGKLHEYRDLKPTIDTMDAVRLLSANKAAELEAVIEKAYAKLAPSVVRIWGTDSSGQAFDEQGNPLGSQLSGVIIGSDGLVLTCAHFWETPGTKVVFELADGKRTKGTFLGRFKTSEPGQPAQPDLRLAKIEEEGNWPSATIGPAEPTPGICLAIGYPGTLAPKSPPHLRAGRLLPQSPGFHSLRSTTTHMPGDSGGPLFDLDGRVLGVMQGGDNETQYESVAALEKHRDKLVAGEIVDAPRPAVRAKGKRVRDAGPFLAALDLEDKVLSVLGIHVRILDDAREIASGTVVAPGGWVVTKRSLVIGRELLRCRLSLSPSGKMVCKVKLVGEDAEHDLALLKVDDLDVGMVGETPWSERKIMVGQFVGSRISGESLRFSVVGSGVRSEAPPLGDVAQLPFSFEPGPNKEPVVANMSDQIQNAELDTLPTVIKEGDVLLRIAGAPTPTMDEFSNVVLSLLYAAPPPGKSLDSSKAARGNFAGEPVELIVRRDSKKMTVRVTRVHSASSSPLGWWEIYGPRSLRRDGFPAVFAHDGAIRPDQCGSPVVDLDGKIVGVNIARADGTRTLAIPAEVVQRVVNTLMAKIAK